MATAQQAAPKNPTQVLVEANVALLNTVVEAGYKAQTRSLNVARVFVEAAGRQQQNGRKVVEQIASPALPWFSPERFSAFTSLMTENQNEMLRIGREYIDELNAAAAESRQTVETIVKHAGKAREAQQALLGEGFASIREYASNFRAPAAAPQA
jgi:hypothetical protein